MIMDARKPSVDSCRITTLCIPTCGRAAYLSQCVSSFSQSLRAHGRWDATVLVIDDSADRVSEARNREVVASFYNPDGPSIRFVGYEDRQRLINSLLSEKVAPPEVIQFALNAEKLVTTEGSVRNTMMLLTGGQHILQTDDDTSCAYISPNLGNGRITLSSKTDPYQTYFYPDRESNLAEFPVTPDIDPFAIHEAVLGKSLADVLGDKKSVVWDGVNPSSFGNLCTEEPRIDVTTTGASGDPGRDSCTGFLTSSPVDTLRRIYSSPDSYRTATSVREILRVVPELTICHSDLFQAMSFGINNTQLQPPFFPLGRGLDDAFALLYCLTRSGALIGHIPYAISHHSDPERRYVRLPWDVPQEIYRASLTYIIKLCLASARLYYDAPMANNLRSIGEQVVAIGSASKTAFRSFVLDKVVQHHIEMRSNLEECLCSGSFTCERWSQDIRRFSDGLWRACLHVQSVIPGDLPSSLPAEEASDKLQSYVLMYGQMMMYWEDITAAAHAQHSKRGAE
jgi:hypothetical protein